MGQMNKRPKRAGIFILILFFMTTIINTGCEPLRKKFVRKKKKSDAEESIPLFEPVDYEAEANRSETLYQQQYSLWMMWHTDVLTALEDNRNNKKILSDLDQLSMKLAAMEKLVIPPKRETLGKYAQELASIKREMDAPVRNTYGIQRRIESLGRLMRENFSPKNMGGSFVK